MALTKEQILAAEDASRELVPVPEWGGEVWVGTMSALDLSRYQASMFEFDNKGALKSIKAEGADVRLAALCIQNEDGSVMFGLRGVEALGKKAPSALDRVVKVAQRLNNLDDDAEDREAGNSEPAAISTSPTS